MLPWECRPEWNCDVKSSALVEAQGRERKEGVASSRRGEAREVAVGRGGGGREQHHDAAPSEGDLRRHIEELAGLALTHSLAVESYTSNPNPRPSSARPYATARPWSVSAQPLSMREGGGQREGVVFTRKVSQLDRSLKTVHVVRREPHRAAQPLQVHQVPMPRERTSHEPSPYSTDPGFGTQFGRGGFESVMREMRAVDEEVRREHEVRGPVSEGAEGHEDGGSIGWYLRAAVQGVQAVNEERMAALALEAQQSREMAGEAVSQVKSLVEAWTEELSRLRQQQHHHQVAVAAASVPSPARHSSTVTRTAATSPKTPDGGSSSTALPNHGGHVREGSLLQSDAGRKIVRQNVDALSVRLLDDVLEETVFLLDAQEKAAQLHESIAEAERQREVSP